MSAPQYFLCRLTPPRSSFAADMTAEERAVMTRHVAYWTDRAKDGQIVVFGPVADPAGSWGVMIVQAADAEAVEAMTADDPAIVAHIGMRYDIYPMPRAYVAGSAPR